MLGDASDKHPPTQSTIHLYVPNVDAVYQRAVSAGGLSSMEPMDQFYGDRTGSVKDPAGKWLKLKAGEGFKINPAALVKADLETILGPGRVEYSRQSNGNGR